MTTQVKIEITQEHVPVIVETLRSDESVQHRQTLTAVGAIAVEYVHSGQTLRVREMTTERYHYTTDRGPVTFKGQLKCVGDSPLAWYQATAAASARKALNVAMESLQKDGWKTPSLNYDELFTFIRDVTLNAK